VSKFSLSYRYNRKSYAITLDADDWTNAERHLKAIEASGHIDGEIIATIPVNDLTRPFARPLTRLILWWKTL
jgi:hypothetical protein